MSISKGEIAQALQTCFPFWNQLEADEEKTILDNASRIIVPRGTNIYSTNKTYEGVFLIQTGALRTFILSEDGREITLYRLKAGQIGSISPNGVLHEVAFDLNIEAEKDCVFVFIPAGIYQMIAASNNYVKLFSYELTISRYSEIMWALQQILFSSFDKRLATFLIDEMARNGSDTIFMTHDKIARYTGSAREVVSRMLRYFASEGLVETTRGTIRILDKQRLRALTV